MTILTPRFVEQHAAQLNGAAGPHVTAAHEPTREGEQPITPAATAAPEPPVSAAPAGPLKVAMIGTAPSSRMLAPYADPSWTIWACSPGNMNVLPRVDLWFELHSNLLWPEHESYGKPYIEWLKQQKFPIYMQDQSLVPNATVFPWYDLVQMFGRDFFTSSFAWMMALAMQHGAIEIALYGIDMASRDEYIRQRPGFYYFKQRAEERGIKVSAPHESDIMQPPALYAYSDSTPQGRKLMARRQEVGGRIGASDQQIAHHTNSKTYLQGALEDIDYQESIWGGVSTDLMIANEKIVRLQGESAQLKHRNEQLETLVGQLQPTPLWSMSGTIDAASQSESARPKRHYRRRQKPEAQPQPDSPAASTESQDGQPHDH